MDNLLAYEALFESALPGKWKGDASTVYFYDFETVIDQMKRHYKSDVFKLKFIAILRNPISRAWSKYTMAVRDGIEKLSSLEAFQPEINKRRMNDRVPLKAYRETFGPFQVVLLDDLEREPVAVLNQMVRYPGLSPLGFNVGTKFNVSKHPKNKLSQFASRAICKEFRFKPVLKRIPPYPVRLRIWTAAWEIPLQPTPITDDAYAFLPKTYRGEMMELEGIIQTDLSSWVT